MPGNQTMFSIIIDAEREAKWTCRNRVEEDQWRTWPFTLRLIWADWSVGFLSSSWTAPDMVDSCYLSSSFFSLWNRERRRERREGGTTEIERELNFRRRRVHRTAHIWLCGCNSGWMKRVDHGFVVICRIGLWKGMACTTRNGSVPPDLMWSDCWPPEFEWISRRTVARCKCK